MDTDPEARESTDADTTGEYASPPCLMHRLDPDSSALAAPVDRRQRADVMRWRRSERERLTAVRSAIPAEERRDCAARIAAGLDDLLGAVAGRVVSVYWPVRGEPDLLSWMVRISESGGVCALPVVIDRCRPMIFRAWRPGGPLQPGIWNIPVPSEGPEVMPDVIVAPVVGFDAASHRLGNGGGYYDRTLAVLPRPLRIIGVGYERQSIRTIYPQPHDIAMDAIVTEAGITAEACAAAMPPSG